MKMTEEGTMPEPAAEKCGCARGSDGSCEACLALIGGLMRDLTGLVVESQRKMNEMIGGAGRVCGPCARRDLDIGLAKAVTEMASEGEGDPRPRAGGIMAAALKLVEAGQPLGVQAYPLTENALKKLARDIGVMPTG